MKKILFSCLLILLISVNGVQANAQKETLDTKKCSEIEVSLIDKIESIDEYLNNYDTETTELIDSSLIKLGVEQIVINELQPTQKVIMLKNAIKDVQSYAGSKVINYDQSTAQFWEEDSSELQIQSRGQIPSNDLTLIISSWNTYKQDGTLDYIRVELWYQWNVSPLNRLQDPIALSWSEDFYIVDDSFTKADMSYTGNTSFVQSFETSPAEVNSNGVVWYADLSGIPFDGADLFGYGTVKIMEKDASTDSGNVMFYSTYVHQFLLGSASINIGPYGSISVSGSQYDSIATSKIHYWDYEGNYVTGTYTYDTPTVTIDRPYGSTFRISDGGYGANRFDVVKFDEDLGVDIEYMKSLGYNYIRVYITLSAKEIHNGYQEIYITDIVQPCCDTILAYKNNIELNGSSKQKTFTDYSVAFTFIDIDSFDENSNSFVLRYSAHGSFGDDWENKNLRVWARFYK